MLVRNLNPAGATDRDGNSYSWKGGDAVDLPDEFANEICGIADSGFFADVDDVVKHAEAEAKRLVDEAKAEAKRVAEEAEAEAERVIAAAKAAAEAAAGDFTEIDPAGPGHSEAGDGTPDAGDTTVEPKTSPAPAKEAAKRGSRTAAPKS